MNMASNNKNGDKSPPATDGRKRNGGNRKRHAPKGYYTASAAAEVLGIPMSTFHDYAKRGIIPKFVPAYKQGMQKPNGYFEKEMIDSMIGGEIVQHVLELEERKAYALNHEKPTYHSEVRMADPEDAEGVVMVLRALGWPAATARQRRSWYAVNDRQDLIVTAEVSDLDLAISYKKTIVDKLKKAGRNGRIVTGYIWAAPFKPEILADMLSGRKRAKNITPEHILPYKPGVYDGLYIGIATLKNLEGSQIFGFRLIAGFLLFLQELAAEGVFIRQLYAVSDEEDGQKLCHKLGFELQPAEPGDLFPRYMLDLETSPAHFAALYRETIMSLVEKRESEGA